MVTPMAPSSSATQTPTIIAFALIAAGLVIGVLSGLGNGSFLGGVIAAGGAVPACIGMWKGIQQDNQGPLALAVAAVVAAIAVGGALIVLAIIGLVR